MRENLHYESVYFKELNNEQECYRPTPTHRAGAAVVSNITSLHWYACGVDGRSLGVRSRDYQIF